MTCLSYQNDKECDLEAREMVRAGEPPALRKPRARGSADPLAEKRQPRMGPDAAHARQAPRFDRG